MTDTPLLLMTHNEVRTRVHDLVLTHLHGPEIDQIIDTLACCDAGDDIAWHDDDIAAWVALSAWERSLVIHYLDVYHGLPGSALTPLVTAAHARRRTAP